jgi:hypothetical protein
MSGLRYLRVQGFVRDIRGGLTRPALMERYGLTSRELHRAFGKVIDAGLIFVEELPEKLPFQYTALAEDNARDLRRYEIGFELPVYDADYPELLGKILNITREGVGLTGMKARVGEVKQLITLGDDFTAVKPFAFQAKCRWISRGSTLRAHVSGFHITRISREALQELDRLIQVVSNES